MSTTIDYKTALQIAWRFEKTAYPLNAFHFALGGSILYKGYSEKDIDLIVYPHCDRINLSSFIGFLSRIGVTDLQSGNNAYTEPDLVYTGRYTHYNDIDYRIDFIITQRTRIN